MEQSSIGLRGEHNCERAGSRAIAHAAGLPVAAMRSGVEGFSGVPHRLEFVRTWGGASWYYEFHRPLPQSALWQPFALLMSRWTGGRAR